MKTRNAAPPAGTGYRKLISAAQAAVLGALSGLLLGELGIPALIGLTSAPSFVFYFTVICAALSLVQIQRPLWVLNTLLLVLYVAIGFTPVFSPLTTRWIRADSVGPNRVNAVVVLSGGVTSDTALDAPGADRLFTGLELLRANHVTRLLTTEVQRSVSGRVLSTTPDQRRFVQLAGVTAGWKVTGVVHTTHDEVTSVGRYFPPSMTGNVVVVTSPMHTRRACAAFEAAGFAIRCIPAREHGLSSRNPKTSTERLAAFRLYVYERLAMLEYYRKGWVKTPG